MEVCVYERERCHLTSLPPWWGPCTLMSLGPWFSVSLAEQIWPGASGVTALITAGGNAGSVWRCAQGHEETLDLQYGATGTLIYISHQFLAACRSWGDIWRNMLQFVHHRPLLPTVPPKPITEVSLSYLKWSSWCWFGFHSEKKSPNSHKEQLFKCFICFLTLLWVQICHGTNVAE